MSKGINEKNLEAVNGEYEIFVSSDGIVASGNRMGDGKH